MGQAQLLLIVLGVVLVGIAIIAGIQAYDANNRKASVDALTHDALRYASDLQLWAQKPVQFGGPTVHGAMSELATVTKLGYSEGSDGALSVTNSNGTCVLDPAADPITITCDNDALETQAVINVAGVSDVDITVATTDIGK